MSDHIPIGVVEKIIKTLPVKSLLRCRSVSKAWKSLIDSSEFIADQSQHHAHQHRILVRYREMIRGRENYVSFVVDDDDEAFLQKEIAPPVPRSVEMISDSRIIVNSLGLFCFYGYCKTRAAMAVLWNPSIRKSIDIPVPYLFNSETILGFGVCPKTSDPKIVKITKFCETNLPQEVKVYALSLGKWRTLSCNLPRESIRATWSQAVIDRLIYWLAVDKVDIVGGFRFRYLIVSFDLIDENLSMVELPDSLATNHHELPFSICKLRDSLAILDYVENEVCVVWKMEEHGVRKSFTKLFTIQAPEEGTNTVGFRKNGEPIMIIPLYNKSAPKVLGVYEPNSKRIKYVEIDGMNHSFVVNSYKETLLFLGWSN